MTSMRTRVLLTVLLMVSYAATAFAAPLEVFVSIPPQKYFVEQVGGKHVAVSVIVEPGRSPATYEPTPRQITRLSRASLYFAIGVAFEEVWMSRIHNANPEMKIIALQKVVPLREVDQLGSVLQEKGRKDPHIWTSPPLVQLMAARIRDALIAEDPGHRADYVANWRRFVADLEELDNYIHSRLRGLEGSSFMVFHPSWGYFAYTYGLQQIPIESGGKEPGARTLQQVIEVGRRKGVKVIFVQKQFSNRTAETVARALGARIAPVDPLAADYLKNLRHVADIFAEALRNQ
ncbi:MAG: zinc ABC transporter substrate-binding protein [Desulfuromonadaceae bacterium]|nr:zinc ABC transporter substrate-binding protein [Desulfuromonadaceae bacterium]